MAKKTKNSGSKPANGGTSDDSGTDTSPYVVLARKYRPQTFDDLIGQEAMVTTLRNAFATDRIAQGYMLTGVRGVGKTTTARILARALNYAPLAATSDEASDAVDTKAGRPSIDMPVLGQHCAKIMESRHPDVLEMDAASNTGIDNIREIIESARYKPLVARYKVYIIDEVHMLSKGAFNALLKTLEEPPEHVKFIFATTEIRKVPVTVLSRCQRFDLRRVDVPALTAHFQMICANEGAEADDEALALIARAAGGSVRDGLSILDQAISTSLGAKAAAASEADGRVTSDAVRAMLGLADRGRIFDLLDQLFGGDAGAAIETLGALHHDGAEASQILGDLLEAIHATARLKAVGPGAASEAMSAEEKRRASALAEKLPAALLSRSWQMLLKGLEEVSKAPNALAAAEMVLIRLAFTADLPAPDELIKMLGRPDSALAGKGGPQAPAQSGRTAEVTGQAPGQGQAQAAAQAHAPAQAHPNTHTQMSEPPPWECDPNGESGQIAGQSENPAPPGHAPPDNAPPPNMGAPGFAPMPQSFAEVVTLAGQYRDAKLNYDLEENVSLVRFEPGKIDLHLLPAAPQELPNELREKLNRWTGENWIVALSNQPGEPAIGQVKRDTQEREIEALRAHPAVQALLEEFPEAEITDVRDAAAAPPSGQKGKASG